MATTYFRGVTGSIPTGDSSKVTVTVTGSYQGTFSAIVETSIDAVADRLRAAGFTEIPESEAVEAKKKPLQHRRYGLQPLGGPAQRAVRMDESKPKPAAAAQVVAEIKVEQIVQPALASARVPAPASVEPAPTSVTERAMPPKRGSAIKE